MRLFVCHMPVYGSIYNDVQPLVTWNNSQCSLGPYGASTDTSSYFRSPQARHHCILMKLGLNRPQFDIWLATAWLGQISNFGLFAPNFKLYWSVQDLILGLPLKQLNAISNPGQTNINPICYRLILTRPITNITLPCMMKMCLYRSGHH